MCIHRLLCGFTGSGLLAAAMRCKLMIICVLNVEARDRESEKHRAKDRRRDRQREERVALLTDVLPAVLALRLRQTDEDG